MRRLRRVAMMLSISAGLVTSPGWTARRMVGGNGRVRASAATSSEERRRMGVRLAQVDALAKGQDNGPVLGDNEDETLAA